MKKELQILIEELQKEHDLLEKEMNICIKSWDFKGAEAFSKPLIYTKQKLQILRNLDNPNFDEINDLKRRIKNINELEVKDEISRFAFERMKARIPRYEEELKNLQKTKPEFHIEGDELIICLEKLSTGELSSFELEVKENKLSILFEKIEETLKIRIESKDPSRIKYHTGSFGISELKGIGFKVNESNAVLEIDNFKSSNVLDVIEILALIVYNVFRLYGGKQARIKH